MNRQREEKLLIGLEVNDLIQRARNSGIKIFVEDGKIKYTVEGGSSSNEFIKVLKDRKEEVFATLTTMAKAADESSVSNPIVSTKIEKIPLSYSQESLWFIDKLHGSHSYHIPSLLRLKGSLNKEALEKSFKGIIKRHKVLRTNFKEENGEVFQVVHDVCEWSMQYQSRELSKNEADLKMYIHSETTRPFDLSNDLLMRASLIEVNEREHMLLIVIHHIVSDGRSDGIVMSELGELYQAEISGSHPNLNPLPYQYADFAITQRKRLTTEGFARKLQFWTNSLQSLNTMEFPYDFEKPATRSLNGQRLVSTIGKYKIESLKILSRSHGATLFMGLLSIFKIMLYRYSGHKDVCIGTPVDGRNMEDQRSLIGFFTNMLPFRTKIEQDYSFTDVLSRVKDFALRAYDNFEVPFDQIVSSLGNDVDLDRSDHPLFNFTFTLQNFDKVEVKYSGELEIEHVEIQKESSSYDLSFVLNETSEDMEVSVTFSTDLLAARTVTKMMKHYENLLSEVISNPKKQVNQLAMLSPREEEIVCQEFNNTTHKYPENKCLIELFRETVIRFPDHVAISFESKSWTYSDLERKSDSIAWYLKDSAHIEPSHRVGVLLHRSDLAVLAILGILKCGASYVPIDPDLPDERVRFIIEDSGIKKVLIHSNDMLKATKLGLDFHVVDMLKLNRSKKRISNRSDLKIPTAYVMYTSGTTGKPKGVPIQDKSIVRLICNTEFSFLDSSSTLFQYAPLSFDASTFEIWGALLNGSKLVIADKGQQSIENIASAIVRNNVDVLWLTAGLFHQVVENGIYVFDRLKYIIAGGDTIKNESIKKVLLRNPNITFLNGYGPTECTTFTTINRVSDPDSIPSRNVIGKPIGNSCVYIVNSDSMNLLPKGVKGEIIISGDGLSQGYLNSPELTHRKFTTGPIGKKSRVYRTGDFGRWLDDGTIEFFGRNDNQVKVRGHRVELDEIQAIVSRMPGIGEVCIRSHQNSSDHKKLALYWSSNDSSVSSDSIKKYLQSRIPSYMVPSFFIHVNEFPLTRNGKIDHTRLPHPEESRARVDNVKLPKNAEEKVIYEIFKDVLKIEQFGTDDNFFVLGGDSILLIKVISQISNVLEKVVDIADFYQNPTVSSVARVCLKENTPSSDQNLIKATHYITKLSDQVLTELPNREKIEDIYPMSDIQKGMLYHTALNPTSSVYHDQLLFKWQLLDMQLLRRAFFLLIERHQMLRTIFNLHEFSQEIQIVLKYPSDFTIDVQDIRGMEYESQTSYVNDYMVDERSKGFGFEGELMWRVSFFIVSDKEMIYLLQFHHAILDGWSVNTLNFDLLETYKALLQDSNYCPAKLKSHYKTSVLHEMAHKLDEKRVAFWKAELFSYQRLRIFDKGEIHRSYVQTYDLAFLNWLKVYARVHDLELKTLFVGTYFYVLSFLTGQSDLTIGLVTNFRPVEEDGEKILGCFLNTIPFRIKLTEGINSWAQYFKAIQDKSEALNSKALSLTEICKILGEHTQKFTNPFFDTILNYLDYSAYNEFLESEEPIVSDSLELDSFVKTNTFLDVNVEITSGELSISYILNKSLVEKYSFERFHKLFDKVLSLLVNSSQDRIDNRDLLPKNVIHRLLYDFNDTTAEFPSTETVIDKFEEQATKYPNRIASYLGKDIVTYNDLSNRINCMAEAISKRGISSGCIVGIVCERNFELIVGIYAILKTGAVYLPIDPTLPNERIEYILRDSHASLVLVQDLYSEKIPLGYSSLNVDMVSKPNTNGKVNFPNKSKPDSPAYIIYTSGSTGSPKGVLVSHKSLMNRLHWMQQKWPITPNDILLQKTSISFDVSLWELFWWSQVGSSLVLLEIDGEKDPKTIFKAISEYKVSVIHFVPSMLNSFLDYLQKSNVSEVKSIRYTFSSGEELPYRQVSRFKDLLYQSNNSKLINLYGPTEATIDVSYYDCFEEENEDGIVPIGRPISNTSLYILNSFGTIQQIGIPGELHISGIGLADGYINNPELTKKKFIENGFELGKKLYKTGDLCRWLEDGNIEFLGRSDNQIKIRGHRIELGEVEKALTNHDLIEDGVVLAKSNSEGSFLVAYYISMHEIDIVDIKNHLEKILPHYMVPNHYVQIDQLPTNPNGKIDRTALDVIETKPVDNILALPSDDIEEKLLEIWSNSMELDRKNISVTEDFFLLGGHSLMAIKLLENINTYFNSNIKLLDVLNNFRITSIAKLLRKQ